MLIDVNVITYEMKSKGHTEAACRAELKDLLSYINETKHDSTSPMFKFNMRTK